MTKYFTNNFSVINLYKKPSVKSEVVTQMIYGDSFSISKKSKKWLKIKIKEDNYKGYILNKKYSNFLKPTHKVISLKAKIFKFPNRIKKNEITFGSKIKAIENNSKFLKFANGWLKKVDVKPVAYKEKSKFDEAISIPETNIAFITPDLIANNPPSSVKITVVNHPRPLEYNAISVFVKPISL